MNATIAQEVEFVRQESGAVTNLLYRGINAPKLALPEMTPARLAAYVGDYWSEELRVARRMEIHDGQLAIRHRSGVWLHFLPTGPDRFDADFGGWALHFTRNESSEVTEVRSHGGEDFLGGGLRRAERQVIVVVALVQFGIGRTVPG